MVKGVNKNIIEINDTGSKYFDRVVFFIKPEHAYTPDGRLENRALDYINGVTEQLPHYRHAESNPKAKKLRKRIFIAAAAVLACAACAALFILL